MADQASSAAASGSRPATSTEPAASRLPGWAGAFWGWLGRRDPGWGACRKAVRVTVAACLAFFVCRYGLRDPAAASYAAFAVVALGALSDVFGPPAVRTRVYLTVLPVAAALVSLGTGLAGYTWTAALGMLVVGFAVAYAGVGGPRLIALATGMQLFYILPCFPPYAPHTLPDRLLGLLVGVGLLALADRVLLPAPPPAPFAPKIADAAEVVVGYLRAVRDNPASEQPESRAATQRAITELRLTSVPVPSRPTGPGRRDRGLTHAAASVRIIGARIIALDQLRHHPDALPAVLVAALLDAVATSMTECAAALRGDPVPPPCAGRLVSAIDEFVARRVDCLAHRPEGTEQAKLADGLRAAVAALAIAESARGLVAATRAAVGALPDPTAPTPPRAWYVHRSTIGLWRSRLLGNLTPRSVYLQNAVRLALGLAAARVAVDLLGLSHGLWVLLATLTLMRTSLFASGAALLPAFGGTLIGAALAGGLLIAIGPNAVVYAVLLPVVMLLAFIGGAVVGPVVGQAGFTLVVATLFAQLAAPTWELASDRLLDVVAGGLVGTVIGAAVWPRGGAGEIHRIAETALRAGADDVVVTLDAVVGARPCPAGRPRSDHLAVLFENTFVQYRSEPGHSGELDWLAVLGVVHRIAGDAQVLTIRHPEVDPLPWPEVTARIDRCARDTSAGLRSVADAIAARRPPEFRSAALLDRLRTQPLTARFPADPPAALRALDAWGWLGALAHDLGRVERAVSPAR